MAVTARDLKRWLGTIPDHALVGIDEGGLTLQTADPAADPNDPDTDPADQPYFEIGGIEAHE